VVIVGRANVGKSTLFNRITKSRKALVDDLPGLTRDRNYARAEWDDVGFTLVDTGGFTEKDPDTFVGHIHFQVRQAIEEADVLCVLFDGKAGLSPYDADLLATVRGYRKPVFYLVNKVDGPEQEERVNEFFAFGIERLYPVSAEHGYGMHDFLDDLVKVLPQEPAATDTGLIKVAVVGRPNVGKSSLINRVLGYERLVVSEAPGTTRDAVDTLLRLKARTYLLIDTAGIRRKGKVAEKIEKFSVIKALKTLDECDVACILLDAQAGVTEQDLRIAGYAYERGCGCIFLANKWDLVEKGGTSTAAFTDLLRDKAKFLGFAPVLSISALTGKRVSRILPLIDEVFRQYTERIGTGPLNRILERAVSHHEPPLVRGKRLKFYYATQAAVRPPTFICFVNHPDAVHFSYQRYLVNRLRDETGLRQTPLRVLFRPRQRKGQDPSQGPRSR